jgi:hypothetical protein
MKMNLHRLLLTLMVVIGRLWAYGGGDDASDVPRRGATVGAEVAERSKADVTGTCDVASSLGLAA